MSGNEVGKMIRKLWLHLPESVKEATILADGEMMGWEVVSACEEEGYHYILANHSCKPHFKKAGWYRHGEYEYNHCMYKPDGWAEARRFVVMRIPESKLGDRQLKLFETDRFAYRIFATDETDRPHKVIKRYDGRAGVENLIKEAQHEGILAIPSKNFHANHAFFQIVMIAYNIWRWMKMLAACQQNESTKDDRRFKPEDWPDPTIRLMRLKFLFLPAKIIFHGNQNKILYSVHDERAPGIIDFLEYLDARRKEVINVA